MRTGLFFKRHFSMLALAPLALPLAPPDCGGPSNPRPNSVVRHWQFSQLTRNGGESLVEPAGAQLGGTVAAAHDYGSRIIFPPEVDPKATAELFSNVNGFTYWVSTEAPHSASPDGAAVVGSGAELGHV